jgi:hypothetical protein
MQLFMLLASVTCKDDGKNVLVQTENILKRNVSMVTLEGAFFLLKNKASLVHIMGTEA